ncbi:hypothetical protein [Iodidimonas sp. SYSU 1G8]|uniref:hypothetical protein n=1 Tax=Iodidimonas sp. SYSU 1G8 TaxID=3133967 RepID=UPI0031FF2B00
MDEDDRVLTIDDYFDQPLKGVAEYRGRPHYYNRQFDRETDAYLDVFILTPLDAEAFELAMAAWGIWLDWKMAFRRGEVPANSHPPHEPETSSYGQLTRDFSKYVEQNQGSSFEAKGVMDSNTDRVRWLTV